MSIEPNRILLYKFLDEVWQKEFTNIGLIGRNHWNIWIETVNFINLCTISEGSFRTQSTTGILNETNE